MRWWWWGGSGKWVLRRVAPHHYALLHAAHLVRGLARPILWPRVLLKDPLQVGSIVLYHGLSRLLRHGLQNRILLIRLPPLGREEKVENIIS